jgi:hypothetical protein
MPLQATSSKVTTPCADACGWRCALRPPELVVVGPDSVIPDYSTDGVPGRAAHSLLPLFSRLPALLCPGCGLCWLRRGFGAGASAGIQAPIGWRLGHRSLRLFVLLPAGPVLVLLCSRVCIGGGYAPPPLPLSSPSSPLLPALLRSPPPRLHHQPPAPGTHTTRYAPVRAGQRAERGATHRKPQKHVPPRGRLCKLASTLQAAHQNTHRARRGPVFARHAARQAVPGSYLSG